MNNDTVYSPPNSQLCSTYSDLSPRLERIEAKLDDHLERVARNEQDISWLRGHLKIATSLVLAVISFLGVTLFNLLFPKH
jgi:hypothetical protein